VTAHFDNNILRVEKWDPEKVWSLAMWNDELGFYYGKRFTLADASAKAQSILGEAKGHRMVVLQDREEAVFQLQFTDENRPPLDVLMSEFIDVKSAKARGKRLSNYEIADIIDITPEPEPEPEEPEETEAEGEEPDTEGQEPQDEAQESPETNREESRNTEKEEQPKSATTEIQGVPFTITNEQDAQLSLDLE
jgi:topoisomerase-4 subunit A